MKSSVRAHAPQSTSPGKSHKAQRVGHSVSATASKIVRVMREWCSVGEPSFDSSVRFETIIDLHPRRNLAHTLPISCPNLSGYRCFSPRNPIGILPNSGGNSAEIKSESGRFHVATSAFRLPAPHAANLLHCARTSFGSVVAEAMRLLVQGRCGRKDPRKRACARAWRILEVRRTLRRILRHTVAPGERAARVFRKPPVRECGVKD